MFSAVSSGEQTIEACSGDDFAASCQTHYIVVTSAIYGRFRNLQGSASESCFSEDYGNLGTNTSVLPEVAHFKELCFLSWKCTCKIRSETYRESLQVEAECSGVTSCSFKVNDRLKGKLPSVGNDLVRTLRVSFVCVAGLILKWLIS